MSINASNKKCVSSSTRKIYDKKNDHVYRLEDEYYYDNDNDRSVSQSIDHAVRTLFTMPPESISMGAPS